MATRGGRATRRGKKQRRQPAAAHRAPPGGETWELDAVGTGARLAGVEDPRLLLVVSSPQGFVRAGLGIDGPPTDAEVVEVARQAMEAPIPPLVPFRPKRLLVRDAGLAMLLAEALAGDGVRVEVVRELPTLSRVLPELLQTVVGAGTSSVTGVAAFEPELCELAADLARIAPWEYIDELSPIEITLDDAEPIALVVQVLGESSVVKGLAIHGSPDVWRRALLAGPAPDGEAGARADPVDALAVWFHPANQVPPALRQAFMAARLAIAEGCYPDFVRLRPSRPVGPIATVEEAAHVLAVLSALVVFLKDRGRLLASGFHPCEEHYRIAGTREVVVATRRDLRDELLRELGE